MSFIFGNSLQPHLDAAKQELAKAQEQLAEERAEEEARLARDLRLTPPRFEDLSRRCRGAGARAELRLSKKRARAEHTRSPGAKGSSPVVSWPWKAAMALPGPIGLIGQPKIC